MQLASTELWSSVSTGKYLCDHDCPGYESRKMCAHTVAAALYGNNLHKYLETFRKESTINLTKLTKPSSVSQKAGKKVENNVNENIIALSRRYQPFNLQLLVNYFQNLLQTYCNEIKCKWRIKPNTNCSIISLTYKWLRNENADSNTKTTKICGNHNNTFWVNSYQRKHLQVHWLWW